ncbi:MAG TPA: pirin family protein [Nocardioidaceae bacterium]|nr:pirin family protein [Nocardioidaceae bacterium]
MLAARNPPTDLAPDVMVVPARRRFETRTDWLESHHSFSFGPHYDPANTHHGLLVVNNDDVVASGAGFDTHPHRDMEVVTWVLEGSLVHQDSTGQTGVVYPGLAQRMSAGSGVWHSERNDSWRLDDSAPHADPVHFVQMWVVPDDASAEPGYQQTEVGGLLAPGALVTLASGRPEHRETAAVRIAQRHAALHVARLRATDHVVLPTAPYLHVFVARGSVDLEGVGRLHRGDAARITVSQGQRVTGTSDAEVLVWEMHATVAA